MAVLRSAWPQSSEPRRERAAILKFPLFEQTFKSLGDQARHGRPRAPIGGVTNPFNELGRQAHSHALAFE
jgi:hypothetical protein